MTVVDYSLKTHSRVRTVFLVTPKWYCPICHLSPTLPSSSLTSSSVTFLSQTFGVYFQLQNQMSSMYYFVKLTRMLLDHSCDVFKVLGFDLEIIRCVFSIITYFTDELINEPEGKELHSMNASSMIIRLASLSCMPTRSKHRQDLSHPEYSEPNWR